MCGMRYEFHIFRNPLLFVITFPSTYNTKLADMALFSFKKTPNAAIYLNNLVHVKEKSAGECAKICLSKSWCRSFDYYKKEGGCDLSDVVMSVSLHVAS
jgi:hypothetical protein